MFPYEKATERSAKNSDYKTPQMSFSTHSSARRGRKNIVKMNDCGWIFEREREALFNNPIRYHSFFYLIACGRDESFSRGMALRPCLFLFGISAASVNLGGTIYHF